MACFATWFEDPLGQVILLEFQSLLMEASSIGSLNNAAAKFEGGAHAEAAKTGGVVWRCFQSFSGKGEPVHIPKPAAEGVASGQLANFSSGGGEADAAKTGVVACSSFRNVYGEGVPVPDVPQPAEGLASGPFARRRKGASKPAAAAKAGWILGRSFVKPSGKGDQVSVPKLALLRVLHVVFP